MREDVIASVEEGLTQLLLRDDDSSDFLQLSFWLYLKRRTVVATSSEIRTRRRMVLQCDLMEDPYDPPSRVEEVVDYSASPETLMLIKDGLATLPPALRELFVLRYMSGWRIGDESRIGPELEDPTLATRYGITPRAVRRRLKKAEEILELYRKDIATGTAPTRRSRSERG